jgi:DNA processing protein
VLDPAYPHVLRHIPDPPIGLWVRGSLSVLDTGPSVAIVGSRNATPGGVLMARTLARGLADAGFVVTSGLARGIDEAAHRGALDQKAPTVAVLGSGVDRIYPPEHEPLARSIMASGAVVAELPPGSRPFPGHFPLRNRIISGLSRAVIVVEASDKSGSLITARAALDVLAVPGSVVSGCHQGCHALIKDGARLVETVNDVLDELGWRAKSPEAGAAADAQKAQARGRLWAMMRPGEPVSLDELATRSGRAAPELLAELGRLELAGHVARVPGGSFVKVD